MTDLIVEGGFAGQPSAGLCCFVDQDMDEGMSLMTPHHRTKISINIAYGLKNALPISTTLYLLSNI